MKLATLWNCLLGNDLVLRRRFLQMFLIPGL
jgi:hypothetical protein